jgi:uroporphyrinogen-III decarboxylase
MNDNNLDKNIDAALNSFDGAGKAMPKPFLFTRLMAKMNREEQNSWEKALRFIARPTVAIAGLCLVIGINAVVVFNNTGKTTVADQAYNTTDEFSTNVASLYNFENTEQQ